MLRTTDLRRLGLLVSFMIFSVIACGDDDKGGNNNQADASVNDYDAAPNDPDAAPEDPDGGTPGNNNGASCTDNSECDSNTCSNISFIGGQCGECDGDDDCASGGCSLQNPYAATGSTCNVGAAGDGCETADSCDGLSCGTVLDLLGLITVKTCGDCETNTECMDGAAPHCTPVFDTTTWEGQRFCLAAGSLSQDDLCELDGNGDTHCASGRCEPIDASGLAEVGACSECEVGTDAGCKGNETCQAGTYDLLGTGTLTGNTCVPK